MLDRFARLLGVSTTLAALVLALGLAEVGTQIYALVDLARRDGVRGGRKWVWALVIALGNLPGAIVYLAAGRTVPAADDGNAFSGTTVADRDATRRALDTLYNPRDRR